jgi:hypothetical protein
MIQPIAVVAPIAAAQRASTHRYCRVLDLKRVILDIF